MHNKNANIQLISGLFKSKDFIDSITSLMMPTLCRVLSRIGCGQRPDARYFFNTFTGRLRTEPGC